MTVTEGLTRTARAIRTASGGTRGVLAFNVAARLGALVALGIATVIIARTGGPSEVGIYALLRVLPGLAGVVTSCGLPGAVPYFIAGERSPALPFTLVGMTVSGGAAGAVGWLVISPVLHRGFFSTLSLPLVAVVGVTVFSQLLVAVGKSCLQGLEDMRGANLAILWEELAFLPAFAVLLPVMGGVPLLVAALVAADLAVSGWIVIRLARRKFFAGAGRVSVPLARRIAGYGLRGQLGGVLLLLNLRFDFAILGWLAGPAVLGAYAVASKYAELLRLPGLAVTYVLYPRFAREERAETVRRTTALLPRAGALTFVSAIPLIALAGFLLPLLYGSAFHSAVWPAQILVAGLVGEGLAGVATAFLYGDGRPGLNSLAMGAGVVATVALDLLLIPHHGAVGAAIASTIAYLLTTTMLCLCFFAVRDRRTRHLVATTAGVT